VEVMGVFMDGGVKKKIFIYNLVRSQKIAVVNDYFPAVRLVEAVYFFAFFTGKNEGKIQRRVFYDQKLFLDLILIHSPS
jgi:hypothetical protein